MVMIFADELDEVVRAPLFGRAPSIPGNLSYAARLARRSGAPVIPAYVLRGEGARLKAVFGPPVHLPEGGDDPQGLVRDAMLLNQVIEPIVMAHLDQWYFLDDRLDEIAP
jgi:KDO2-lipid IV(A) lauroyltransferase